jgi:hypothetical protein
MVFALQFYWREVTARVPRIPEDVRASRDVFEVQSFGPTEE